MDSVRKHGLTWVVGVAFVTMVASTVLVILMYGRIEMNNRAMRDSQAALEANQAALEANTKSNIEAAEIMTRMLEFLAAEKAGESVAGTGP